MKGTMWGNQYRTTVVCIDSYENGVLSGRMYNPYLSIGDTFQSTMEFLKKTDSMLDRMKFPQSFSANRVFEPLAETKTVDPPAASPKDGLLGTFALRILFRQNASWQGSVTWIEGEREESFRSVLELLLLMDSALCSVQTDHNIAEEMTARDQ